MVCRVHIDMHHGKNTNEKDINEKIKLDIDNTSMMDDTFTNLYYLPISFTC